MANFAVFEEETKWLQQNLGSADGNEILVLLLFQAIAKIHYTGSV